MTKVLNTEMGTEVSFAKWDIESTECFCFCAGLKALARCSELLGLKIGICLKISNEGLTHIGRSCPKLRDIDLYRSLLDMPCGFLCLVLCQ